MDASGLRARLLNLAVATAGICVLSAGTSAQYLQYPPEQKSRCVHAESFLNRQQAFNTAAYFEGPQPFDVQHYKLDLDLPMTTDELRGRCVMTLLLKASVDSLVLNAVGLSLDSVRVDATPVDVTLDTARETFTLHLQQIRNQSEVLTIELAYHRIREYIRRGSRYGYYYFSVDSVVGLPANLGYTMSEPSDARFWMPCFDEPWDKATAEVNITVPRHTLLHRMDDFWKSPRMGMGLARGIGVKTIRLLPTCCVLLCRRSASHGSPTSLRVVTPSRSNTTYGTLDLFTIRPPQRRISPAFDPWSGHTPGSSASTRSTSMA